MHTWTLADVRCLLLSITEVWVTSDEVNSIMGKKSVIFKEKRKEKKKKTVEKFELNWHREPLGPKEILELTGFEPVHCFYNQE